MPKSTAVSRAGAATNRLPSCRSAWKTPWSSAWARKARIRLSASAWRSRPGCVQRRRIGERRARRPLQGQHPLADALPDHRRRAHVAVVGHHLAQLVGAGRLEAQVELQLQRADHRLGEGARLQPPRRRRPGARPAARPARSAVDVAAPPARSMPGRSTFTATCGRRPAWPRCAWASEAAASGLVELGEQRLERTGRAPRRPRLWPASVGNGGSRSFSRDRSSAKSAPKMSARVERNWPSLIATGPSRSSAARQPLAGPARARASRPANRRRNRASVRAPGGSSGSSSRGISASARISTQRRAGEPPVGREARHRRLDRPALVQGRDAAGEVGHRHAREARPRPSARPAPAGRGSGGCSRPDSW